MKYGSDTSKWGTANCTNGGISAEETTVAKLPETNPLVKNVAAADWDGSSTPTADQLLNSSASNNEFSHAIFIYQYAKCDGEAVTEGTGARNLAIQFKLEGGGVYCGAV